MHWYDEEKIDADHYWGMICHDVSSCSDVARRS